MSVETAPRPKTEAWGEGDVVIVGRVRWAIRILQGEHVELEAMNVPSGMWWTTTLDRLPEKTS